jgi:hypothetical protein
MSQSSRIERAECLRWQAFRVALVYTFAVLVGGDRDLMSRLALARIAAVL